MPGPQTGCIIPDIAFSQEQKDKLSNWLNATQIERLEGSLGLLKSVAEERKEWPTLGDDRKVLQALADLFSATVEILEGRSESVKAVLDGIAHEFLGDFVASRRIGVELCLLRDGIEHKLEKLPAQGRPHADLFSMHILAAHAREAGIKLSCAPGSKFLGICSVVWPTIGHAGSPVGVIRAYLNSENGKG